MGGRWTVERAARSAEEAAARKRTRARNQTWVRVRRNLGGAERKLGADVPVDGGHLHIVHVVSGHDAHDDAARENESANSRQARGIVLEQCRACGRSPNNGESDLDFVGVDRAEDDTEKAESRQRDLPR